MLSSIKTNVPLATYTTLGVGGNAEYFSEIYTEDELFEVIDWARAQNLQVTVIGSGSNVLISDEGVRGLVIRLHFEDIVFEIIEGVQCVKVGAGVLLDSLVSKLVSQKFWGLENLSGIPGTVGAAPIQNVGAYGIEMSDVLISVTALDMSTQKIVSLSKADCLFGYRSSIFKDQPRRYIILSVVCEVTPVPAPRLSYRDLQEVFNSNAHPDINEVREAVLHIRSQKFPDWKKVGTAGSFFKNTIITENFFNSLKEIYPEMPGYDMKDGNIKISLGWILDRVCGLRGYTEGNVKLFEKQALVLVCERGIAAKEVEIFSQKIIENVFLKTGIYIEREVSILS